MHLRPSQPLLAAARRGTLALAALAALAGSAAPASASSHREAPGVLNRPQTDGTDFYMFRSYEPGREGYVTLIANYVPLQDAYGGPNYFPLDNQAFYDIEIYNNGDTNPDRVFRFRFSRTTPGATLDIGGKQVAIPLIKAGVGPGALDNERRSFTLQVLQSGRARYATNHQDGNPVFAIPYDNLGEKTFPDYAGYAAQFVQEVDLPGCPTPGRVFVGQRHESFNVNLGAIFDLVNLNPVGARDASPGDTADKNITALALEVPAACLRGPGGGVIAGISTASQIGLSASPPLPKPIPLADLVAAGPVQQSSRLGMPLVNEVVIGLPDKDRFNASRPGGDARFLDYVTHPTLPALLQALFGVEAPHNFPRQDLVAAFLTGVPGLNQDGSVMDALRLNLDVTPTARAAQNNLGVLGGDSAGFPNGRRPGDDVVDIELRVAMGVLCHAFPGVFCAPADAPAGNLPYTDQVLQDAGQFTDHFPYLQDPLPGSPQG